MIQHYRYSARIDFVSPRQINQTIPIKIGSCDLHGFGVGVDDVTLRKVTATLIITKRDVPTYVICGGDVQVAVTIKIGSYYVYRTSR